MNKKKTDGFLLIFSIFCFLLLGLSFILMPIESDTSETAASVVTLLTGVLFWLSLGMGLATQVVLSARRKKNFPFKKKGEPKLGFISFFKNIYAIIADIGMMCSFAGLVIAMIVTQSTGFLCYVFAGMFVFLLSMHCILNGKNFYYISQSNRGSFNERAKNQENKGKEEKDNG